MKRAYWKTNYQDEKYLKNNFQKIWNLMLFISNFVLDINNIKPFVMKPSRTKALKRRCIWD